MTLTDANIIPARPGYRVAKPAQVKLARSEELALLEQGYRRSPGNDALRKRLALAYFAHDRFDETIALLDLANPGVVDAEALHVLVICLLARENDGDTLRAIDYARRTIDATDDPRTISFALSALGKAQQRLGQSDEAAAAFVSAIDLYPNNKDALKRLSMLHFLANRAEDALQVADQSIARGYGHSRALAVRTLALARLGRIEEARDAFGLQFLELSTLPVPDGWTSLEAFNRDVADELVNHPGYHYDRYGAASTQSWRVDDPEVSRFRALSALQRALIRQVEHHVDAMPPGDHQWQREQRSGAMLHGWSVISMGAGYEEWHVHQNGWLSGSYYVEVPEEITIGDDNGGCIAFGLPEAIVGEEAQAAFGLQVIRPRSGMVALFPSHCFHRTFAYTGGRRRICFAFDIAPPPSTIDRPTATSS